MEEIKKITEQIEYLTLKKIIEGLKGNQITKQQAQQFAREFLKLEPFSTVEDAKNKVNGFCEKFPYFDEVNQFINRYFKEKKTAIIIEKMKKYLENKDVTSALKVAMESN